MLEGGIKYECCSGKQGRNDCVKSEKGGREVVNSTVVLKENLRKETNGKKPVITF